MRLDCGVCRGDAKTTQVKKGKGRAEERAQCQQRLRVECFLAVVSCGVVQGAMLAGRHFGMAP